MKKKKLEPQYCLECGGDLESSDNQNSHSNSRTCVKFLQEELCKVREELREANSLREKLDLLEDELHNEIRKRNGWVPERRYY